MTCIKLCTSVTKMFFIRKAAVKFAFFGRNPFDDGYGKYLPSFNNVVLFWNIFLKLVE